jgi:RNA polymerase sigma-70 factor (ECF subfamily)
MIPTKDSVEPDDRQLVEQIRQGDEGAFETLVRRKTSKVYGLCYRVIGNGEDAKDISQLVFLKLWDNAVNSNLRLVKTSIDPEQTVTVQRKEVESVFNVVSNVLSPKQKTIFVMSEMEDLRSSEIAKVLGCRESTVRNHLFNARKLMQAQLKKRFPEYARLWEESR